jgi:hypothetical protein
VPLRSAHNAKPLTCALKPLVNDRFLRRVELIDRCNFRIGIGN